MIKKILFHKSAILAVCISIFTQSIAIKWFYQPSHLAMGGFSGISLAFEYIFKYLNIPITYGTIAILINMPLLLIAWKKINRSFTIFTLINIVSSSILVDYFPIMRFSNDVLVNAFAGSVIYAFGVITCLHAGVSQGGTDILGVYLSKNGKGTVGKIGLYVTVIAFMLTYYTTTFTLIIYSLLSTLLLTIIIDRYYQNSAKVTLLVVSKKIDIINRVLNKKIVRGTTIWNSKGGYRNDENNVLMITISSDQKAFVYNIINKIDDKCFITSLSTESTIGEWTNRVGERKMDKKISIDDFE